MTQIEMILGTIVVAASPFAVLLPFCVGLEMLVPRTEYSLKDRLTGTLWTLLVPGLMIAVSWPLHELWVLLHIPSIVDISGLPAVARVVVLLLFFDFLRYWEHRFEHRFWWPVHAVHHSPTELHAANAFSHPLIALPEFLLVVIPVSLVETGGGAIPVTLWTILSFQNFIIHSPLRIHAGRLRAVYVDSRYHRIHHSVEERHWHQNFGFLFSFWDKLFGTAYPVDGTEWPDTGVPGMAPAMAPVHFFSHPFLEWRRLLTKAVRKRSEASLEGTPTEA